ncbi:hypothetical protein ACA910_022186 [Epithemia clementina (nom. ined.)]
MLSNASVSSVNSSSPLGVSAPNEYKLTGGSMIGRQPHLPSVFPPNDATSDRASPYVPRKVTFDFSTTEIELSDSDDRDTDTKEENETREDTDSKISLVSYLGSEDDSYLNKNFQSSTVPMIVRMLDKGCAWLEDQNCGGFVPKEGRSPARNSSGATLQFFNNISNRKKNPLVEMYASIPASDVSQHIKIPAIRRREIRSIEDSKVKPTTYWSGRQERVAPGSPYQGDLERKEKTPGIEESQHVAPTRDNAGAESHQQHYPLQVDAEVSTTERVPSSPYVVDQGIVWEPGHFVRHDKSESTIIASDSSGQAPALKSILVKREEAMHDESRGDEMFHSRMEFEPVVSPADLEDQQVSKIHNGNWQKEGVHYGGTSHYSQNGIKSSGNVDENELDHVVHTNALPHQRRGSDQHSRLGEHLSTYRKLDKEGDINDQLKKAQKGVIQSSLPAASSDRSREDDCSFGIQSGNTKFANEDNRNAEFHSSRDVDVAKLEQISSAVDDAANEDLSDGVPVPINPYTNGSTDPPDQNAADANSAEKYRDNESVGSHDNPVRSANWENEESNPSTGLVDVLEEFLAHNDTSESARCLRDPPEERNQNILSSQDADDSDYTETPRVTLDPEEVRPETCFTVAPDEPLVHKAVVAAPTKLVHDVGINSSDSINNKTSYGGIPHSLPSDGSGQNRNRTERSHRSNRRLETNMDMELLVTFSDEQRLEALEFLEKLKGRAEELKLRKGRARHALGRNSS